MKVLTIEDGVVTDGVIVERFTIKTAGISIPAILIGEEGRGRRLGVLPVRLLPESYREWEKNDAVNIRFASVGQTRRGAPKLIEEPEATVSGSFIGVFRTPIGYRGSNSHTGDRAGWECRSFNCSSGTGSVPDECQKCGGDVELTFSPFPGDVLIEGTIAQGDAGRMGSGEQIIATVPAGTVFRTGYSGRRYDSPYAHYYLFDGDKVIAATWRERQAAGIF